MLTRCPQCLVWFRLRAEHLTAANGFVTCGRCDHVFSALTTLFDDTTFVTPARLDLAPSPALQTTAVAAAAAARPPLELEDEDAVLAGLIDDPALSTAARAALVAAAPPVPAVASPAPIVLASADNDPPEWRTADRATRPQTDFDADQDAVPAAIYADLVALEQPGRPPRARFGWAALALLLVLAAVAQTAFVERLRLAQSVPESLPVIDFLCARVGCSERQDDNAVRLLARDVREHPQYRDALLVNATIVNQARTAMPFPVIDLRLRDAAGRVLSARQFRPAEYLDQSIPIEPGMPSARPVYIVLELAGNAADAVSFEFTFL